LIVWDLFRLANHVAKPLSLGLAFMTLSTFCVLYAAKSLGQIVTLISSGTLLEQKEATAKILQISTTLITLEAAAILTQYLGSLAIAWTTTEVALAVRKKLFAKLRTLPIAYFDREPLGRTITRLTSDVEGMEQFFSGTLTKIIVATIRIVGVFIAMMATDGRLGTLVVISALPALIFPVAVNGPLRRALHLIKRQTAKTNAKLTEYISARSVIRHFGLEAWSFDHYKKDNDQLYAFHRTLMNWNSFIRPVTVLLCSLPILTILGMATFGDGMISVALFTIFVRLSERFIGPIRTISQEIQIVQDALASSERVASMLKAEDEDNPNTAGYTKKHIDGKIEFRHVSMSYLPGKPVVEDLNFVITPGQTVGVVGRSGSGKSTTLALIPRLYGIDSGEILIDDIPVSQWNLNHLRSQIGIINQDVEIFRGTLRENLLLYCSQNVCDERISQVCEDIGLGDLVQRDPAKLGQLLQERGKNISQGQRQLIAFGRLILREARILIFDEATASVDPNLEKKLFHVINRVLKNQTRFIVAHRLETIRNCDLILVYLDGRIVERGTFASLLNADGYFAQLYRSGGEVS
jgi:ABC-type multidrug transport system fused ATPase/permease subunit